jgi:hypothetical protein
MHVQSFNENNLGKRKENSSLEDLKPELKSSQELIRVRGKDPFRDFKEEISKSKRGSGSRLRSKSRKKSDSLIVIKRSRKSSVFSDNSPRRNRSGSKGVVKSKFSKVDPERIAYLRHKVQKYVLFVMFCSSFYKEAKLKFESKKAAIKAKQQRYLNEYKVEKVAKELVLSYLQSDLEEILEVQDDYNFSPKHLKDDDTRAELYVSPP